MAIVTRVNLLKYRRTKIVATIGPGSAVPEVLTQLIAADVNVFRLNMSHGEHANHTKAYHLIRQTALELGKSVAILADLCGPKIRTGKFENDGILLESGQKVTITMEDVLGTPGVIPSQYKALASDVTAGDRILLADGLMELKVIQVAGEEVECEVVHGGKLGNHKGINLPGVKVSAPSMTEKDFADAEFALNLGVDFIALSFVREAKDLVPLREMINAHSNKAKIISKIEKPEALDNADEILEATDAIMVARGDLGVELPPEEVPVAQRELITLARNHGKPVIVATQMLESMITNSRPTRAEVTDVSHAVDSGADAVMLSGETAVGDFPVEAVKIMDRIARQTEAHIWEQGLYGSTHARESLPLPIWNVIANATSHMSRDLMARAVMVITRGGTSAGTVSIARPAAPIVGISSDAETYRQMALLWGVIPLFDENAGKVNPNDLARDIAHKLGLEDEGGYLLLVRGFHGNPELNSPSITVIGI